VPDLRDGVSRLRPHFYLPVARAVNARNRAAGVMMAYIIADAPTGHF
jgi:hypothetical protein